MKNFTKKATIVAQLAIFSIKTNLNCKRRGDMATDKGTWLAIGIIIATLVVTFYVATIKGTIFPYLKSLIDFFFTFR